MKGNTGNKKMKENTGNKKMKETNFKPIKKVMLSATLAATLQFGDVMSMDQSRSRIPHVPHARVGGEILVDETSARPAMKSNTWKSNPCEDFGDLGSMYGGLDSSNDRNQIGGFSKEDRPIYRQLEGLRKVKEPKLIQESWAEFSDRLNRVAEELTSQAAKYAAKYQGTNDESQSLYLNGKNEDALVRHSDFLDRLITQLGKGWGRVFSVNKTDNKIELNAENLKRIVITKEMLLELSNFAIKSKIGAGEEESSLFSDEIFKKGIFKGMTRGTMTSLVPLENLTLEEVIRLTTIMDMDKEEIKFDYLANSALSELTRKNFISIMDKILGLSNHGKFHQEINIEEVDKILQADIDIEQKLKDILKTEISFEYDNLPDKTKKLIKVLEVEYSDRAQILKGTIASGHMSAVALYEGIRNNRLGMEDALNKALLNAKDLKSIEKINDNIKAINEQIAKNDKAIEKTQERSDEIQNILGIDPNMLGHMLGDVYAPDEFKSRKKVVEFQISFHGDQKRLLEQRKTQQEVQIKKIRDDSDKSQRALNYVQQILDSIWIPAENTLLPRFKTEGILKVMESWSGTISGNKLGKDAITPDSLEFFADLAEKGILAKKAIKEENIADGAVTLSNTDKYLRLEEALAEGAIKEENIADGAVTPENIQNFAYLAEKKILAQDAITKEKLADEGSLDIKSALDIDPVMKLGRYLGKDIKINIGDSFMSVIRYVLNNYQGEFIQGKFIDDKFLKDLARLAKLAESNLIEGEDVKQELTSEKVKALTKDIKLEDVKEKNGNGDPVPKDPKSGPNHNNPKPASGSATSASNTDANKRQSLNTRARRTGVFKNKRRPGSKNVSKRRLRLRLKRFKRFKRFNRKSSLRPRKRKSAARILS